MRSYFVDKYCREQEAQGLMGGSPKKASRSSGRQRVKNLTGPMRFGKQQRRGSVSVQGRNPEQWGMNFARGFTKSFIESSVALSYFPVDRLAKLASIDFLYVPRHSTLHLVGCSEPLLQFSRV